MSSLSGENSLARWYILLSKWGIFCAEKYLAFEEGNLVRGEIQSNQELIGILKAKKVFGCKFKYFRNYFI